MKHYNLTIIGKVQGVFYRQSTCEKANQLGVKGFVRNEPNGNVYIEAEGEEERLKKLIEWCKVGPPRANATDILVTEGEIKNFPVFAIRRN